MMSRFGYLLQLIGKLGFWGYFMIAFTTVFAIVGALGAPEILIPTYIGIGFVLWFVVLKRFVEVERLNDIGLDGEATIISIAENGSSLQINGALPKAGVTLKLEARVPGSSPYQAIVKTFLSQFEIQKFQPGSVVRIKVDPEQPQNIVIAEGTAQLGRFRA